MKILSIFRKKSNSLDGVQDKGQEMLTRKEETQSILQEYSAESVASLSLSDTNSTNKENDQTNKNETKEELSVKNFKDMLSAKSELLKKGEQLFEECNAENFTWCPSSVEHKKDESTEDYKKRCTRRYLLQEDFMDWREYARLYIFKNQVIPDHYDEFMSLYKSNGFNVTMAIRKIMRIVETCK